MRGCASLVPPHEHALRYYQQGADELIYIDAVASLYGRNHLSENHSCSSKGYFCSMTAGGGIRSVDDVTQILRAGADKVTVNTAAVSSPGLITEISKMFGNQCMVLSIEVKRVAPQPLGGFY